MTQSSEFTIPLSLITKIIVETVTEDISGLYILYYYFTFIWSIFLCYLSYCFIAVQEDYIKALSRATSLFILYCTTRANEVASENNRRSVYSQDVLQAIDHLGFDHLVPELVKWHSAYVEEKGNLKITKKKKTDDSEGKLELGNSTTD